MLSTEFYEFLAPHYRQVFDVYIKNQSPLLDIAINNGRRGGLTTDSTTHEWDDLVLDQVALTVGASGAPFTVPASATVDIPVGNSSAVRIGSVFMAITPTGSRNPVQVIVTANNTTTNTLTVKRYGTTSVATPIAAGSTLRLLSVPNEENKKTYDEVGNLLPSKNENYTQIFDHAFGLSDTVIKSAMRGNVNSLNFHLLQAMTAFERQIAQQLINGVKVKRTGTAVGSKGSAGGLFEFIDTIVSDVSTQLNKSMINDVVAEIFKNGASAGSVVCSLATARAISAWNESRTDVMIVNSNDASLGTYTKRIVSDIPTERGIISEILIDTTMLDNELIVLNKDMVSWVPYEGRDMRLDNATLPAQDGFSGVLKAEGTFEILGGSYSHGIIRGFTL